MFYKGIQDCNTFGGIAKNGNVMKIGNEIGNWKRSSNHDQRTGLKIICACACASIGVVLNTTTVKKKIGQLTCKSVYCNMPDQSVY